MPMSRVTVIETQHDDLPPGGPPPHLAERPNPDMSDEHNSIFFAAVKTTRMPMIVTDPRQHDNPIVFANPAFINMTGYAQDELVGRNCRLLQGPDTDRETIAEVRRAIAERREIAVEVLNYKKNGASFWNALFVSPVYDSQGNLIYFFASQLDVSRRRDAEDALRQAQKMEAIGQLTGGVAHDFNNLLTVIQGFSDMLRGRLDRPEQFDFERAKGQVDAIIKASERGGALTAQLLAFARKQKLQGRIVNVNELIDQLTPIIERTAGGEIAIEQKLSSDICNSRIDTTQAELAILNILINARDAMPKGGRITIETAIRKIDKGDEAFGELAPGRYVSVSITDTGSGMPPAILQRVTEPFFTTKEQGRGTGLGLSMVYGFTRQSGGALRIYSEEGLGTTVRLFFPCVEGAIEPEGARAPRPMAEHAGQETILLVEDQPDVGDYAQEVLEEFGYRVLRAGNGPEALELLDRAGQVSLLFTDLIMPGGMNGVVLAREARSRRPRIKVLLTTGYAENSLERVDARGSEFDVINKPYKRSELAAKVRQTLDGPTGVG
jgi:PAS domain S-box-containing protein